MTDRRALIALILTMAACWHALSLAVPERPRAPEGSAGRDYATYHYATRVALEGGDPYDTTALTRAAREDGIRANAVHPWLYPPSATLAFLWSPAVELGTGLTIWRVVCELSLLGSIAVVAFGWRELDGARVLALMAVTLALMSGVAYGHQLGQANAPVFLLALAGLLAVGRTPWAGVLLGLAVLGKLAPALFLGLWLLERRFRAVGIALVTVLVGMVGSLAVVGFAGQSSFWTRVLPGMGAGDYNGLRIRVGMFGNASLPSLLHTWMPADGGLSVGSRVGSLLIGLVVGVGLIAAFRGPSSDPLVKAGRIGAVAAWMLILPAYTFEHHLIWAVPAVVVVGLGIAEGRLPRWTIGLAGLAFAVLCVPVPVLKRLHTYSQDWGPIVWGLHEAKHLSLWIWLVLSAWIGRATSER